MNPLLAAFGITPEQVEQAKALLTPENFQMVKGQLADADTRTKVIQAKLSHVHTAAHSAHMVAQSTQTDLASLRASVQELHASVQHAHAKLDMLINLLSPAVAQAHADVHAATGE